MNFNAINSFAASSPLALERANDSAAGANQSDASFGSAVRDAVESLERTQKGAETEIARAVAGESPDLHRTIISLQTADLSFQLGLQVRNKLIGAYEEIMRMQV